MVSLATASRADGLDPFLGLETDSLETGKKIQEKVTSSVDSLPSFPSKSSLDKRLSSYDVNSSTLQDPFSEQRSVLFLSFPEVTWLYKRDQARTRR